MTLTHLLAFSAAALAAGPLVRGRGRGWLLLAGSVLAGYWLQPATPIRNLDFWLPTATLAVTVLAWAATRPGEAKDGRRDRVAGVVLALLVLGIGLTRYLGPLCCLTPTRPPQAAEVLLGLALIGAAALAVARFLPSRGLGVGLFSVLIVALFVILKSEPLAEAASAGLRALSGQATELASALDIQWLGFSYVAFRLLHALRDRLSGRLPDLALDEFVTYAIFFPAFTAGPIDRAERFVQDLRRAFRLDASGVVRGGRRVVWGVFKKFALADSLALIALDAANVGQTSSTPWMWVLLYAYTLRIYFDFSGYTDIAIGIGQLLGVRLPENFERPYLQPNLTAFWNGWHITLAQWFRAYFFNPLTRALRAGRRLPAGAIILAGQLGTMVLIGLWHGLTWNFAVWGVWHGLGLFAHNRWAAFTRSRAAGLNQRPALRRLAAGGGTLLTFHFVALGWVWFALPSLESSWRALSVLFGFPP